MALIAAPPRLPLLECQSLVEESGETVEGVGSRCRFWASGLGMPVWLHPTWRQRHSPSERTGVNQLEMCPAISYKYSTLRILSLPTFDSIHSPQWFTSTCSARGARSRPLSGLLVAWPLSSSVLISLLSTVRANIQFALTLSRLRPRRLLRHRRERKLPGTHEPPQ